MEPNVKRPGSVTKYAERKGRVLFYLILICSLLYTVPAIADSLTGDEEILAKKIITCIKEGSKSDTAFFPLKKGARINTEKIVKYIDGTCGPYYQVNVCHYGTEQKNGQLVEGFRVYIKSAKVIYDYNHLINKKAKKIVKRYVRKSMTKKQKAKAIAKGIAKTLSYKKYGRKNYRKSMLKNLQNNKGACNTYSHLYQACCMKSGLKCEQVIGYANGLYHAWNRVRLGEKWGYVDSCWYDLTGKKKYIRIGKQLKSHKMEKAVAVYICS